MNAEQETDFQTWAKLLIRRKVPDDYQHLINQEVIHNGEIILRRGDAFEIHIRPRTEKQSPARSSAANSRGAEIQLTPLTYPGRSAKINRS